jgi:hypothetical protein
MTHLVLYGEPAGDKVEANLAVFDKHRLKRPACEV